MKVLATYIGDLPQVSFPVELPIEGEQSPIETQIHGWVCPPVFSPEQSAHCWLLCIPGASYSGRGYYDRLVPGYGLGTFSLSRSLARRGIGILMIDTLGTGASACPHIPGTQITRALTTQANVQVISEFRTRLYDGTLVPGLPAVPQDQLFLAAMGHSMGAFQLLTLAVAMQDAQMPLDAVMFTGSAYHDIQLPFDPHELFSLPHQNGYILPGPESRELFHPFFYGPSLDQAVIDADGNDAVAIPLGFFQEALEPQGAAKSLELAGLLRSPILHVLAEYDLADDLAAQIAHYHSSPLVQGYTQPDAWHCNFESSRTTYWQIVADFVHQCARLKYLPLSL